ncbi:hypothetical protein AWZ03_015162, partial [Drosophila navojoa]
PGCSGDHVASSERYTPGSGLDAPVHCVPGLGDRLPPSSSEHNTPELSWGSSRPGYASDGGVLLARHSEAIQPTCPVPSTIRQGWVAVAAVLVIAMLDRRTRRLRGDTANVPPSEPYTPELGRGGGRCGPAGRPAHPTPNVVRQSGGVARPGHTIAPKASPSPIDCPCLQHG